MKIIDLIDMMNDAQYAFDKTNNIDVYDIPDNIKLMIRQAHNCLGDYLNLLKYFVDTTDVKLIDAQCDKTGTDNIFYKIYKDYKEH